MARSEEDMLRSERDMLRSEEDMLRSEDDGVRSEEDLLRSEDDGVRSTDDGLEVSDLSCKRPADRHSGSLPSKWIMNWLRALFQNEGALRHFFSTFLKARKRILMAAMSLGKCPLALVTFRSW